MGVSEELHAAIGEIARAEDRSRHAVVKRAIDLYRQHSEAAGRQRDLAGTIPIGLSHQHLALSRDLAGATQTP